MAKKLKGKWWKDTGLFKCKMKPYISHNEGKSFLNIVKCNPFPMDTMWRTPKLLNRLKYEFEVKTTEGHRVGDTFLGSQHFGGD
jgi:hypothetical protein